MTDPFTGSKRRKPNHSSGVIQTLAEQIKAARNFITGNLVQQHVPILEKQLSEVKYRLSKPFRAHEINLARDLAEQKQILETQISEIKSGQVLNDFNKFISDIQLDPAEEHENVTLTSGSEMTLENFTSGITNDKNKNVRYQTEEEDRKEKKLKIEPLTTLASSSSAPLLSIPSLSSTSSTSSISLISSTSSTSSTSSSASLLSTSSTSLLSSVSSTSSLSSGNEDSKCALDADDVMPIISKQDELEDSDPLITNSTQSSVSSHIYAPITFANSERNETKIDVSYSLQNNIPLPKINDIHERITDWKSIAPKRAERHMCDICKKPLEHWEEASMLSCHDCGHMKLWVDNASAVQSTSSSSRNNTKSNVCAKFDQILENFNMDTWISIPDEVYNTIRMDAQMGKQLTSISANKIKDILKARKMKSYFEHIVQIYTHLNARPPPLMTKEQKNLFRQWFKKIREAYEKYKETHPNCGRNNFLNYSLVFVKLCEALDMREFIQYIDILKSGNNLRKQEDILQNIMADLGLSFESSFQ